MIAKILLLVVLGFALDLAFAVVVGALIAGKHLIAYRGDDDAR